MSSKLKVAYFFTTFPVKSETFFQRELQTLSSMPTEISIFSLWGGNHTNSHTVRTFNKWNLLKLPFHLLFQLISNPRPFLCSLKLLLTTKPKSLENLAENLLGFSFALLNTSYFKKGKFNLLHATWATSPGAAVFFLNILTNHPYTLEGHAYDLFENDGDMFLSQKISRAQAIRTSSFLAQKQFIKHGANPQKIRVVRHPLLPIPKFQNNKNYSPPLKIISIGRLIEKKGFFRQLEIFTHLKESNFPFHAKIIGDGPLKESLEKKIKELNLTSHVTLTGWLPYEKIETLHSWADVHLFTGIIAKSGDRDGLPTVVTESMAKGTINISSSGGAIPEAITHNQTGILINDYANNKEWLEAFKKITSDQDFNNTLRQNARSWFDQNCDPTKNMQQILNMFSESQN